MTVPSAPGPSEAGSIRAGSTQDPTGVDLVEAKEALLGRIPIARALPRRPHRTVGSWCFLDHMGPVAVDDDHDLDVPPHPHIGLQTVTWVFDGELLHRDSVGSEQTIRPGQLNLMTAGRGVAHSEEGQGRGAATLHGVQLWVAQPAATRHGEPAFEHHGDLPGFDLPTGEATVFVGSLGGVTSPARRDTDHFGAELVLQPGVVGLDLDPAHEHGLLVVDGQVEIDGRPVATNVLAYLAPGRSEVTVAALEPSRCILLGGVPFSDPLVMWWNYVAADRADILAAHDAWTAGDEDRFGVVRTDLPRTVVPPPPWAAAG